MSPARKKHAPAVPPGGPFGGHLAILAIGILAAGIYRQAVTADLHLSIGQERPRVEQLRERTGHLDSLEKRRQNLYFMVRDLRALASPLLESLPGSKASATSFNDFMKSETSREAGLYLRNLRELKPCLRQDELGDLDVQTELDKVQTLEKRLLLPLVQSRSRVTIHLQTTRYWASFFGDYADVVNMLDALRQIPGLARVRSVQIWADEDPDATDDEVIGNLVFDIHAME